MKDLQLLGGTAYQVVLDKGCEQFKRFLEIFFVSALRS